MQQQEFDAQVAGPFGGFHEVLANALDVGERLLAGAILVPHAPAVTGRIAISIAAALVLCHGLVLHHADTTRLDWDDVAGAQIVMANALFLIAAAALSWLAAWRAGPGSDGVGDRPEQEG